ncbi:hypothetical protein JCM6882_005792 [Rhodosporidiobolus microsporus]
MRATWAKEGKSAVKALRSPAYAKLGASYPQFTDDDAARNFLHSLIPFTFFLRCARGPTISPAVKALQINPQQLFAPDEHFVWLLPADPTRQLLYAAGMVAVVLAGVMFPLWPVKMRIGVWYLSMGVLGLIAAFFGLAIVRLVLWVVTKVAVSPGIWLFPNLFADVGFVDSFIPLWGWDVPPPKKAKRTKEEKALAKAEKKAASKSKKSASGSASPVASRRKTVEDEDGPLLEEVKEGERGPKIVELSEDDDE